MRPIANRWQVVAEVPSDVDWGESTVQLSVLSGETCWFGWTSNWLWTESPRIQALTSFQVPESPALLEFRALVDIGGRYTETACPYGDGHDGRTCQIPKSSASEPPRRSIRHLGL